MRTLGDMPFDVISRRMTVTRLVACVLVASIAVGCAGRLQSSSSSATGASASTIPSSGAASASPTAISPAVSWPPTQTLTAGRTDAPCAGGGGNAPAPGRPNGWPVILGEMGQFPRIGLDGMSYVVEDMKLTAIDATGREPAGWPVKLNIDPVTDRGYAPTDVEIGSDGTIYVAGGDRIQAFHPDATPVSGWPYRTRGFPYSGFVPAVLPVAEGVYTDANAGEVVLLGRDGAPRPGWPVPLPGASGAANASTRLLLGPDGTLYIDDLTADAIYAYGSDGNLKLGWPLLGWSEMTFDPSGRMYVWKHRSEAPAGTRYSAGGYSGPAIETDIAGVDSAGRLYPGWPLKLNGPVSQPAFGPDGTVYATRGTSYGPSSPQTTGTSATLLAFDQAGNVRPGWPVSLPAGYWVLGSEPGISQAASDPPAIAPNGSVYVIAVKDAATGSGDNVVFAVLPNGRPAPGWPRGLGAAQLSNVVFDQTGYGWLATGTFIYLVSDNRILGLQSDGTLASGWPLSRPCGAAPQWVRQTPDGGLLVLWNAGAKPYDGTLEMRYRADGSVAGS